MDNDQPLKMPPEKKGEIDYSRLNPPEPMGGPAPASPGPRPIPSKPVQTPAGQSPLGGAQQPMPASEEPASPAGGPPKKSLIPCLLMIFLFVILIIGILVFFSWKGWISLGGKATPTATPKTSPTLSPAITTSPATSPEVTTNINDQTRKADLASIKSALKKYYTDNSSYPLSSVLIKTSDSTSVLAKALVPNYLEKLPDDPLAPQYYYGYKSDGKTFELTAVLEDKSDPAGSLQGNYFLYKITDSSKE